MIAKHLIHLLLIMLLMACSQQSIKTKRSVNIPNSSLLKDLHYLSADKLEGRKVGTAGGKLTQKYIIKQLKDANVEPFGTQYLAPFLIEGIFSATQGNNIVAVVPGTQHSEKFIVLSAHFDHLGGRGSRIYNGADDNASGTSALLHYAALLKKSPLRYSVILLFTDGEEANLKGASAFITQNSLLMDRILLNINIDMIAGASTTKKLRYVSRGLDTILTQEKLTKYSVQQKQAPVAIKKGFKRLGPNSQDNKIKWEIASDHGAFYRQKIPFIYFGVGTHRNYHQTSDTYENVNHAFFIKAVETIYQQITFIDQNL